MGDARDHGPSLRRGQAAPSCNHLDGWTRLSPRKGRVGYRAIAFDQTITAVEQDLQMRGSYLGIGLTF
jgi:hypothetical protein